MTVMLGSALSSNDGVVRFGTLRMWAERGLIRIEDSDDNSYKILSIRATLERMRAIQDIIKNSRSSQRQKGSDDQLDRAWLERNQQMLDAMISVVKKAQIQGSPDDASARRDLVRRRPKTVVLSGDGSVM